MLIAAFVELIVRVAPLKVISSPLPIVTPAVPVKSAPNVIEPVPLMVIAPVELMALSMVAIPELVNVNVPAELIAPLFVKVVEVIPIFPEVVVMAAVETAAPFKVIPVDSVTSPPKVIAPATGVDVALEASMDSAYAPLIPPVILTAPEVPVLSELLSIAMSAPRTTAAALIAPVDVVKLPFNVDVVTPLKSMAPVVVMTWALNVEAVAITVPISVPTAPPTVTVPLVLIVKFEAVPEAVPVIAPVLIGVPTPAPKVNVTPSESVAAPTVI